MKPFAILILLCQSGLCSWVYPLKLSQGNHYMVDQSGKPFFMVGDSPWYLTMNTSPQSADFYMSNRWVQGFNTIILDITADELNLQPADWFGNLPFTNTVSGFTNFAAINPNYWTNVDYVINRAAHWGILVLAYPAYDGDSSGGWFREIQGNSSNAVWTFGFFLGSRYRTNSNIIWVGAGDDDEPGAPSSCPWNNLAAGIKAGDMTNHLFTAQAVRPVSAYPEYSKFVTVNSSYPGQMTYVYALTNYNQTPVLASFDRESYYEHRSGIANNPFSANDTRMFGWWDALSGSAGGCYGDSYQWHMTNGWQSEQWDIGATTFTNIGFFMQSRPWTNLVPDQTHTVLTAGFGTYGTTNWVTCARDSGGLSVIAYTSGGRPTLTIDMTKLSGGSAIASWFNPRTCTTNSIGTFATTGSQNYVPPDNNDWVLAIDSTTGPSVLTVSIK